MRPGRIDQYRQFTCPFGTISVAPMEMREQVRAWLIDAKFGIIGTAELTALADQTIAALDEPPDYLVSVSLGEPLFHIERLDIVKYPITQEDLGGLAARLLSKIESQTISAMEVATIATNISFPSTDEPEGACMQFDWISDEAHLIGEGISDGANFRDDVIAALRSAVESTPGK